MGRIVFSRRESEALLVFFVCFVPPHSPFQNPVPNSGLSGSGLWTIKEDEKGEWFGFGKHDGDSCRVMLSKGLQQGRL